MAGFVFRMVFAAVALLATSSSACTIVAVGKDASASGYPITSHTDDSGGSTTDIRWIRVPRKQWPAGSTRKLYNWNDGYPRVVDETLSPEYAPVNGQAMTVPIGEIPQVPETFAYWDMDYGVQNEKGLSIGESTCTAKTVGWPATPEKQAYGYNRAGIEDLSKIALERCETARCAVDLMGSIAVEQGFYSADSGDPAKPGYSDSAEALVLADPQEVWIFNVLTGPKNASAIWAAQRIPSDHVAAVGNSFTIREIDFKDPDTFRYSPGVTKLAEEQGWWNPNDGAFDFFCAYGYTPEVEDAANEAAAETLKQTLNFYSGRRMWRIFSLLSPEEGAKLDPNKGNLPETKDPYPASVPAPRKNITAQMVMDVLRDHYEGTPYDLTVGFAAGPFGNPNRGAAPPPGTLGIWERAIAMQRSSWSYVLEAKPAGKGVSWLGLDSPHATAYLPFYGAATEGAPESFHSHDGYMSKFSNKVAWWAFDRIASFQDINFQLINKDVMKKTHEIEHQGKNRLVSCEKLADEAQGKKAAMQVLTDCSNKFAEEKIADMWDLGDSLFAKFGRQVVTYNESATGEGRWQYPAWWIESLDVGFASWRAEGKAQDVLGLVSSANLVGSSYLHLPLIATGVIAAGALGYTIGVHRGRQRVQEEADAYAYLPA